ncbi:MAG: hypothetical protein ACLQUZ_10700 [Rhizomicrobium sp.]
MRRNSTAVSAVRRSTVLLGLSIAVCLGLAGCDSLDDALFGTETPEQSQAQAPAQAPAPAAEGQLAAGTMPGSPEGTMPGGGAEAATAPVAGITPVAIEQGSDTGTAVNHTIQVLRSQVSGIQDVIIAAAQKLAELKGGAAQSSTQYHEAKALIAARLQLGTTRGNPELVAQWNNAQAGLDSLTANINALNALGTTIASQSSAAHFALNTIQATFNVSGAVDEDHHQLSVLRDETEQVIVLIDSLLSNVSDTVQRQTTYVANERASLMTLASAIKDGSYYGDLGSPQIGGATAASYAGQPISGPALVTIRFDHPNVAYQQILYTAVAQALQSRPGSSFAVIAVSPTRGSAAAIQLAQTAADRHARDVLRSLTDMGIPATRLDLSSMTDPNIATSEVRVYVR